MSSNLGLANQIKELAIYSTSWRHHNPVKQAYEIYDRLNANAFEDSLPQCVIGLDDDGRIQRDGRYYYEGDSVSLPHHIDLMPGLTEFGTVVALPKNMEHLRSEVFGKKTSWYHSLSWRKAMKVHGLVCKANGEVTDITEAFETIAVSALAYSLPHNHAQFEAWRAEYLAEGKKQANRDKQHASTASVAETASEVETWVHSESGETQDVYHPTDTFTETLTEQGYVLAPPKPEIPAPPTEPKPKAKVFKWACACVKGIAPSGERGTTSFWTTRVHPNSTCGACGEGFTIQD